MMSTFSYKSFNISHDSIIFNFESRIDEEVFQFKHKIEFKSFQLKNPSDPNITNLVFYLGMAIIPYYYTLQFADKIIIEAAKAPAKTLSFFEKSYRLGLAEFMHQNNIPFERLAKITVKSETDLPLIQKKEVSVKMLVAHGGGKDSIASGELLTKAQQQFAWFSMGYDGKRLDMIMPSVKLSSTQKHLIVNQDPDPYIFAKSFKESHQQAYLGHKPMGMYLSFLGILCSYVNDFKFFVVSNEASANTGNTVINDMEINHQYSKSLEYESDFRNFIHSSLNVGVEYFSLLRPFSELSIAQIFLQNKKYLNSFMSCNFGIDSGEWCQDCPKCAFVFIMIASLTSIELATNIIGENLLLDPNLENTFLELMGEVNHKPFECVGETEEAILMISKIIKKNDSDLISSKIVLAMSKFQVEYLDSLEKKYLESFSQHFIPEELWQKIKP